MFEISADEIYKMVSRIGMKYVQLRLALTFIPEEDVWYRADWKSLGSSYEREIVDYCKLVRERRYNLLSNTAYKTALGRLCYEEFKEKQGLPELSFKDYKAILKSEDEMLYYKNIKRCRDIAELYYDCVKDCLGKDCIDYYRAGFNSISKSYTDFLCLEDNGIWECKKTDSRYCVHLFFMSLYKQITTDVLEHPGEGVSIDLKQCISFDEIKKWYLETKYWEITDESEVIEAFAKAVLEYDNKLNDYYMGVKPIIGNVLNYSDFREAFNEQVRKNESDIHKEYER